MSQLLLQDPLTRQVMRVHIASFEDVVKFNSRVLILLHWALLFIGCCTYRVASTMPTLHNMVLAWSVQGSQLLQD